MDFHLYVNHGIHHDYTNFSSGNFIDPKGTKAGLGLAFDVSDNLRAGVNFTGQHLNADSSMYATGQLSHYSAGVTLTYEASENLQMNLNAGVNRVSYDNGSSSATDNFGTVGIGTRFRF